MLEIPLEVLICENCKKTMKNAEFVDGKLNCPNCGAITRIIIIGGSNNG